MKATDFTLIRFEEYTVNCETLLFCIVKYQPAEDAASWENEACTFAAVVDGNNWVYTTRDWTGQQPIIPAEIKQTLWQTHDETPIARFLIFFREEWKRCSNLRAGKGLLVGFNNLAQVEFRNDEHDYSTCIYSV